VHATDRELYIAIGMKAETNHRILQPFYFTKLARR
jgi:hypothetical protein